MLLATRSAGKLRELRGILAEAGIDAITLEDAGVAESPDEEGIECHSTFEDNALAKARWFHGITGLPTMADDSGLCVTALGGAPGVISKRYSGRSDLSGQDLDDANNARLQRDLREAGDRSAHYSCAAAFVDGVNEIVAMGETCGEITTAPSGTAGFGYDPYFLSSDLGKTFGDAEAAEKQGVSHRGRAFRSLVAALRERSPV